MYMLGCNQNLKLNGKADIALVKCYLVIQKLIQRFVVISGTNVVQY